MPRPTKKADPQIEAALKRWDILAQQVSDLAEPIAFYRAALSVLHEAQAEVEPFTLDPATAQQKLASGLPLLIDEDLPLEIDDAHNLFIRLCRIAETVGSPEPGKRSLFKRGRPDALKLIDQASNGDGTALRAAATAQIRRAVEKNDLDLPLVLSAYASGEWRRIELMGNSLKLDTELLRTLTQNSLKPALRAWAQGFKGKVLFDNWQRGQCPICGSPPALTEIQGKEGARRLRCAMCGADWPYPRLQCAFCGNKDYKSLGYISVQGEEDKYRVQTCDICRGYLKVVVTFDPTPVDQLTVEDLATLHLDLIAVEREFMRVPVR